MTTVFVQNLTNWRNLVNSWTFKFPVSHELRLEPRLHFYRRAPSKRGSMLKIHRAENGEIVFKLIGRMDAEHAAELRKLFQSEDRNRPILMDLTDLTLVDGEAVRFLDLCETDGIKLKNCPAYIREWITRQRPGS